MLVQPESFTTIHLVLSRSQEEVMAHLDVARFVPIYVVAAMGASVYALRMWKGKISLFAKKEMKPDTALRRVALRYAATGPASAIAFVSLGPGMIVTHYFDVSQGSDHLILGILQWPFWVVSLLAFGCALTIPLTGKPLALIPPNMRRPDGV